MVRAIAHSVPFSVAAGCGLPVVVPVADVQPAGLERGAVRGRGQLAVACPGSGTTPRVVLAGGAGAEVAGGDVDDPVRQLERLAGTPPPTASSRRCSAARLLGPAEGEHLDLVEPVHPDDAAGVLAVGAGLAAEAGRPAGVAPRAGGRGRGSRSRVCRPARPRRCRRGRGRRARAGRPPRRARRGSRCPPSPPA